VTAVLPWLWSRDSSGRQREPEAAAPARVRLDSDPAVVALDDAAADGQAQAGAAVGAAVGRAVEGVEHVPAVAVRDADATVGDLHPYGAVGLGRGRDVDPGRAPGGGVFDRVAYEVVEDVAQQLRVGPDRREHAGDRDLGAAGRGVVGDDLVYQLGQGNNVAAILFKLQVSDRAAAVAKARDAGLGGMSLPS
jgi:hypothetical protein